MMRNGKSSGISHPLGSLEAPSGKGVHLDCGQLGRGGGGYCFLLSPAVSY